MTLKLYGSLVSQPTRAVVVLCRANNIDFELVEVDYAKKEHKKPEFKALNPAGQLPVIDDNGWILPESTTILRYLAASRHLPDHWYPADVKARARVDYLLDWYHTNLRSSEEGYVVQKEYFPRLWKKEPNAEAVKTAEQKMTSSMDFVEQYFLKADEEQALGKGPFLLGASQPSIADITLGCEYSQLRLLPQADQEKLLAGKDKTKKWLEHLEKTLEPHFAEVHKSMDDLVKSLDAQNGN